VISYSTLGARSRFGNHLFQYAFLRSQARRLGVQFYCPRWHGDEVMRLDDGAERAPALGDIVHQYAEPEDNPGFNEAALRIGDGTNVQGYFQSARYFDREPVRRWYQFKDEKIAGIRERYRHVDFAASVGIHVRLGDFLYVPENIFYVARSRYYRTALDLVRRKETVIVFSDDIPSARRYLGDLGRPTVYVEGSKPYEDLYLQTQCRDFICSASTFSWWGAWLSAYDDKVIVVPKEGQFRPGSPVRNDEFWLESWIKLRALRPGYDHYQAIKVRKLARRGWRKARRLMGLPQPLLQK